MSWTARGGLDLRNEIYGTEGAIFTDVTRETPIKVFSRFGVGYTVEKAESETGWLFPPVDEAWTYGYREEMRHFIECVGHRAPRETFADGYRQLRSRRGLSLGRDQALGGGRIRVRARGSAKAARTVSDSVPATFPIPQIFLLL